ncbi:tyrosine-type recombinase/integrase [Acetobacter sp.]|jgi:integrase|uniref:tyrosine-type recombinase/integrase n=1 Tax=Acetobacter sp. TaxID=440 RepID=UPI0025BDF231|nr:tyrosine-type recombinase/integrase [Acetobacter sp.]MCH4086778.1 tyrosine-type recombinase/integrase [Acetobacter sp.]MCH4091839.1 tyrosine-type recombinase/integrase [Acetobacter sp.]MCH4092308.1 tyrosine-type recombinase/integrase [Acetobacter sp.]
MLIDDVNRYITLRRSQGFKLEKTARHLEAFARYAAERADTHIRIESALDWSSSTSSTQRARYRKLQELAHFARFLRAEDPLHEVPDHHIFYCPVSRPTPYIYSRDEIARMLAAAGNLRRQKPSPLRQHIYVMLIGLLASTGLRVSEALNLRLCDLLLGDVLHIRQTKFNKSRLVPMHPSVAAALRDYLAIREQFSGEDDHMFLSVGGKPMGVGTLYAAFHVILRKAGIGQGRTRRPRIHDLRHTFATRVLEQCSARREDVARDFIALSTYLGHAHIRYTYWYLQATPELMRDIAGMAEYLIGERLS